MKKIKLILLSILLVISITGCNKEDQSQEFLNFINRYTLEEISNDYVSMHTYFENPENYGIDVEEVEVSLGDRITEQTFMDYQVLLSELKLELDGFKRSNLNEETKKIYDEFVLNLNQSLELSKDEYMYLGSYFEADTGIHIDMTTLFSEWVLRDENDVKELLLLVGDVKEYMSSIVDFTVKQAEKGYLMVDLDSVIDYCQGVVDSGRNSSILVSLKDSIDKLSLDSGESYKVQLEDVFMSSFIPAYEYICDTFIGLKDYKNNLNGLSYLDNGKEYYEDLLKVKIGSNKSIKEVRELLEEYADKALKGMQELYLEDNSILEKADKVNTEFNSYKDIMEYLKDSIKNDFPLVDNLNYDINEIDPKLSSKGISAYYVVPAIDSRNNKQIKVNTHNNTREINDIRTYTTIAHEGIPGHMYMYGYLYDNSSNLYYKVNNNLCFTEGYATYVEFYSMKYLENIDYEVLELLIYNELYSSCIIALSDIGIHYDGWDFGEFSRYLEINGMTNDEDILQKQYKQLQANPAAFIPYYVGVVEVLELREYAVKELGNKFNDKEFHKVLLQDGSRTFNVIEYNIEEYIYSLK